MSTTYGFKKPETRLMAGFKYTLAILMGMLRSSLGAAWSMARVWLEYGYTLLTGQRQTCEARNKRGKYSQCGNVLFPVWECFIPNVGIKFSLNPHILRSLLFLMLVLGGKAWGQDYSGTYYIATVTHSENPEDNFYLCPTEDWYYDNSTEYTSTPNGKPFLTTYKCRGTAEYDASKALWVIQKHPTLNYYYIKHGSQYLTYNDAYFSNKGRVRVHLEDTANGDYALFAINYDASKEAYEIISKYADDNNTYKDGDKERKYLNVNKGNKQSLKGKDDKVDNIETGGIIGLWTAGSAENTGSGRFYLEEYIPRSSISSPSSSQIVVSHDEENMTIYYTTDGTNPSTEQTENKGDAPLQIEMPENAVTLRTIAAKIADNLPSCVTEIRVVPNATITLGSSSFTYNGSAQEPTITVKDGETPIANSEYTVTYSDNTNAGNATVTINNATGGGYIVYGSKTFTINKKALTITADSETKVYDGTELTKNTYINTALADGDAITSVTVTGSQTVVGGSDNVPSAAVIKKGDEDRTANYEITYVKGTLTVTKKALTITADAKSKTYGEDDPALTYTSSGLVGSDAITGALSRETGENAGTYAINQNTLTAGDNYSIAYTGANLTINKKALTITADAKSKTYGEDDPALTYTSEGLIGTDAITGTLSRDAGENAGTYAINQNTLTAGNNYAIAYTGANLTINKKDLTITADAKSKTYGEDDPALTYTASGLVGGDAITGELSRETGENVGTYAINKNTLTASTNYTLTYVPANLTINKKGLTITADAKSKTYGDADPELTYTQEGLVSGDAITGALSREDGENAGTYVILLNTLTAGANYTISYTGANLTISPKSLGNGETAAEGITIDMTTEGDNVVLNYVKDGETTLVKDTDYTLDIQEEASDKIVEIAGIGNYTGSIKGVYVCPVFTDPDGESSGKAAAVYTASQDLACPNSIKPYIVRKVNPSIGTITITQLDYIPEGVPVLLLSDAETSGFVASPKDEATPEITVGTKNSNQLKVSHGGETVAAAQIYMFYQGEFVLTKAGTLGEGKYFLYNPNFTATSTPVAQSRSVLQFVIDDDVTEVDDVRSKMADVRGDWYTLEGQRLNGQPTKSGIYIRKGQKMYIKRK